MNTTTLTTDPITPDPFHTAPPVNSHVSTGAEATLDVSSDRRPAFVELVRTELRKMRDTRSGLAVIGTIAALTVGIPIIMLVVLATGGVDSMAYFDFVNGAEPGVRLLLPVLVVLLVTSEWSQRSAMTTFALVPDRARIISAKFVAALTATAISLAAVLMVAAVANLASSAFGNEPLVWNIDWTSFGTYGLTYLFDTLLAFALGVALLSSAGALVGYFIVQLGVSTLLFGAQQVSWLRSLVPWVDPGAVMQVDFQPTVGSNWAHLAVSSLIWIGIPMAIGIRRVLTTEIK